VLLVDGEVIASKTEQAILILAHGVAPIEVMPRGICYGVSMKQRVAWAHLGYVLRKERSYLVLEARGKCWSEFQLRATRIDVMSKGIKNEGLVQLQHPEHIFPQRESAWEV